jgi:glycosyltransferase involved in cell wall biosynthesis
MNLLARRLVLFSEDEKKRVPATQRWKVKVANNTLNFRDMPEVFATKEDLKKIWGIPFRKVVLFSGRIQARKRIGHLLRAFEHADFAEYGLVVVGPGELAGLKAWAQRHQNAVILGPQYDPQRVAEIFKMADVFCIPGAVGLSINQAFFWGLPIVTEVAQHGPEICYLRDGENGFMVKDANQLACRLLELLRDDGLRRRMSMNARATILREGSIETMTDGFFDAIREVSRRGARRCCRIKWQVAGNAEEAICVHQQLRRRAPSEQAHCTRLKN